MNDVDLRFRKVLEEVRTFRATMYCPKCPDSTLTWTTGLVLLSDPPRYEHKCQTCGYSTTFGEVYPRIEYK